MSTSFTRSALQDNLRRLLIIRSIVFVLQLIALLYTWQVLALELNYGLIFGIFLLLALLNGALYIRLERHRAPRQEEFFLHLLIDIMGLTLLMYFTGGASNPFISYLLVPITIAAATLRAAYSWMLTTLALGCYSLLLFYYQPLPALMPGDSSMQHDMATMNMGSTPDATSPSLHIIGMWFNFVVSSALITWFVVRMAADNRKQETRLSQYREDTLRNEQIVAVATLAAGTAHELGTPLGSMAILLKELEREHANNQELSLDLKLLQNQVSRCRDSLRTLAQKADFKNLQPETLALGEFILQLIDQWRLLRPEVQSPLKVQNGPTPLIQVDLTLQQALMNMLNNAADSSPAGLELSVRWDKEMWSFLIRDYGEGISREVAEQLGSRFISTKASGMGVGLVLTQATLNRLGGTVNLFPQVKGGTLTEITLPLKLATGHTHV